MNLLQMLRLHGQSIWLNGFDCGWVVNGQLQQYLDSEVRGIISNFSSLERSLQTSLYDRDFQAIAPLHEYVPAHQADVLSLYNFILVREMQLAAEHLKEVHERTDGKDGYINLELPVHVINSTESILTEARRLWQQIGWSNLMLSIPVTPETLLVIQQLIGEGINVNATQVVSLTDYEQVTEAYLTGLEVFAARNGAIDRIASVASVPVNSLDAAMLRVGIAQAKVLYQHYRKFYRNSNTCSFAGRWQVLAEQGAHPQRLGWMLTDLGSKTQLYAKSLMGANTVIVLSPTQLAMSYQDDRLQSYLTEDLEAAHRILARLSEQSLNQVIQQLRIEAQARSQVSFAQLLQTIEQKQQSIRHFES